MVTIRKADIKDLEDIKRLNHALFLWDYPHDSALNTEWPLQEFGAEYFQKRILEETGVCFVAEKAGKLVGYVTGHVDKDIDPTDTLLRCELDNIYIENDSRGSGIGRRLIAELEAWCKIKGAQSMLVVAYSGNLDAIGFYENYGFRPYALKLERKL